MSRAIPVNGENPAGSPHINKFLERLLSLTKFTLTALTLPDIRVQKANLKRNLGLQFNKITELLLPQQEFRPEGEIPKRHSSNSRVY